MKCHDFMVKNKGSKSTPIFKEFPGEEIQNNEDGETKSQNILFGR